jgi:hypothetical protein
MPYIVPVYNSEKRKRKFDLAGIEAKLIFQYVEEFHRGQ